MISKLAGTFFIKNTKIKATWIKLGVAIVVSNLFFFLLLSGPKEQATPVVPEGWLEVQVEAQLLTPFQIGKKVLIINRAASSKLEGVLKEQSQDGKITVLIKEKDALMLFGLEHWEIVPFIQGLIFPNIVKGAAHEIRY